MSVRDRLDSDKARGDSRAGSRHLRQFLQHDAANRIAYDALTREADYPDVVAEMRRDALGASCSDREWADFRAGLLKRLEGVTRY